MTDAETHAQPACRFCGFGPGPTVLRRPRFDLRRCPSCLVWWCDPLRLADVTPAEDGMERLGTEASRHARNTARLDFTRKHAPCGTHRRLVEVGCMFGDFVHQAYDDGYQAFGLDHAELAIHEANRRRPGLVRMGVLDEAQPDASVDVVTAFEVVERMDRPDEFLDQVHRVLANDGVFVVESPAMESLRRYIDFARGRLQSRHPTLEVGINPGGRMFGFGTRAWTKILESRGFEILELRLERSAAIDMASRARTSARSLTRRAGSKGLDLLERATRTGSRVLLAARRCD